MSCANADARKRYDPAYQKARYSKLKLEFVAAYGGKCYCCGETELAFLTLDHVQGGGIKDREGRGTQMYQFAKKEGWPKLYRLACMNCNLATARGRICPHQKRKLHK